MLSSSSRFMTTLRGRLGRPRFRQSEDGRPKVSITSGNVRKQGALVQAIGFDVLLCSPGEWFIGQKVMLGFRSQFSNVELVIPGRVHWREQKQSEVEMGIVLDEQIPDEFVVQDPGCSRKSIRYPSNIVGTLNWLEPHSVSYAASVVNYSREGICLQSGVTPQIGTELQFSWLRDSVAYSVTGISRWVIGKSGGSLTGCELTSSLGYAISGLSVNSGRASL